jgi:PAS domain S-box-containing protein
VNRDLRFVRVNERMARFTGKPVGAHPGRPVEDVLPSEGSWLLRAICRVLETGEAARGLQGWGRPDGFGGDPRTLRVDLEAATDADGEITGVVCVVHDVTEQQRVEASVRALGELARSQLEELEAVYAYAPVGLAFLDRQLRFVRINERLAGMNGSSVEQHIGRHVGEMVGEMGGELVSILEGVVATGSPVRDLQMTGRLPSDPEREHEFLVNHHPVKGADGSVDGVIAVVQDITGLPGRDSPDRS